MRDPLVDGGVYDGQLINFGPRARAQVDDQAEAFDVLVLLVGSHAHDGTAQGDDPGLSERSPRGGIVELSKVLAIVGVQLKAVGQRATKQLVCQLVLIVIRNVQFHALFIGWLESFGAGNNSRFCLKV